MIEKKLKRSRGTGKRKGQALVEFCLCIPILLLLLIGSADLGFLLWTEMTITEAIRSGAVFATAIARDTATWNAGDGGVSNTKLVQNYIVAITGGTGLNADEITITPVAVDGIESLTIKVTHIHTYMAPISFNGLRAESTVNTFPIDRSFTCGFIANVENYFDFSGI